MLTFPLNVHASCDYERQAELSRIASNVQINYSYEVGWGAGAFFTAYITNVTNDIYITDNYAHRFSGNKEGSASYLAGSKVEYTIYSNDSSCYGEKIVTQYLDIPHYNSYSQSDDCKENPNFKYCQLWDYVIVDTAQFKEELEKYKQAKQSDEQGEEETIGVFEQIKSFIVQNYVYILIAVATLGVFIIGFKIYRRRH